MRRKLDGCCWCCDVYWSMVDDDVCTLSIVSADGFANGDYTEPTMAGLLYMHDAAADSHCFHREVDFIK